jgi:hypothetical protein
MDGSVSEQAAPVTVLLDASVPRGDEAELKEALSDLGFAPTALDFPTVRGVEHLDAMALMMIPLEAFLKAAGTRLAAEAYAKFRSGLRRILNRQPEGAAKPLVLQDSETGIRVLMERDLPDEAYEAFRELDLTRFGRGPLSWDRSLRRWRSIADEADAATPS